MPHRRHVVDLVLDPTGSRAGQSHAGSHVSAHAAHPTCQLAEIPPARLLHQGNRTTMRRYLSATSSSSSSRSSFTDWELMDGRGEALNANDLSYAFRIRRGGTRAATSRESSKQPSPDRRIEHNPFSISFSFLRIGSIRRVFRGSGSRDFRLIKKHLFEYIFVFIEKRLWRYDGDDDVMPKDKRRIRPSVRPSEKEHFRTRQSVGWYPRCSFIA